jgi:hypothetical protein
LEDILVNEPLRGEESTEMASRSRKESEYGRMSLSPEGPVLSSEDEGRELDVSIPQALFPAYLKELRKVISGGDSGGKRKNGVYITYSECLRLVVFPYNTRIDSPLASTEADPTDKIASVYYVSLTGIGLGFE